jgi:1,4-alpha-glucan branching enzyme
LITVHFSFLTGLKRQIFTQGRLAGSWDGWMEHPMLAGIGEDGCPGFSKSLQVDDALGGQTVRWGVRVDGPQGANLWGINLEVPDPASAERYRELVLPDPGGTAEAVYHFTVSRYLGAQKFYPSPSGPPAIRFAVWAPNAEKVDVVFGRADSGYIADDGTGIDPGHPAIPLERVPGGLWESAPVGSFADFGGLPYMYRIVNAQGRTVYRTDIHSRWQVGRGDRDPAEGHWNGDPATLDGGVSCSMVIDQDVVRESFRLLEFPRHISDEQFWATEFVPGRPVPTRVEDLIVYELHVGSLGFGRPDAGTLADALALVPYLSELGVNAVELLPLSESSGTLSWGYGDTHHFVIESSAGGRNSYKHFVRECHRYGIAVIQDVVYNHFDSRAGRAEWEYDSSAPDQNIYYWYEGQPNDYPHPNGGYLNNGSSGWTPRFYEEPVRQLFISSAAEFVEEFHIDGLRVDLTQAIHRDNSLMANGWGIGRANAFGQKFLREWSRTLQAIRPSVMLIAEDHTGWPAVTQKADAGGLGFDATWFADFYHSLIGDADSAGGKPRLIKEAGYANDGPLDVQGFAGVLAASAGNKVVYHESHDEAGNAAGSARTAVVAVNGAPLWGATRKVAEARCRVAAGLSILSAGTPMFFMGEEIVARRPCRYDNIAESKEDLFGERNGEGGRMFRYYQDLIRLSRDSRAIRSHNIDVVHAYNPTRVIAFTRSNGTSKLLVVAGLNNSPFIDGYVIQSTPDRLESGEWREIFNSDSSLYGGDDTGNFGVAIPVRDGRIELRVPANGVLVLHRI